MVYEYSIEFRTLLMKAVNDKQKFKHVPYLNLKFTPVFLFNQERVLGSQHNGINPICISLGHPPDARVVNREDANAMRLPGPTIPSTFQVTHF